MRDLISRRYILLFLVGIANSGCHVAKSGDISPEPTPLVRAIENKNRDEVRRLLDSGANPNQISSIGPDMYSDGKPLGIDPPLACAASSDCDTDILQLLIGRGADPNLVIAHAYLTVNLLPIDHAINNGCTKSVDYLLRHGANPNLLNYYKMTVLDDAIGDRNHQVWQYTTRLYQERFGDTSRTLRWRVYDTIIDELLKYGVSPNLTDGRGWNSLHRAAMYCDSALAEKFIALGTSLIAKDKDGNTPQDIAIRDSCAPVLAVFRRHENSNK